MAALKGMLLLNSETLSHFEYHWFWGLLFKPSIVREGNMAVQARLLAQDEPLLRSLQEQQRTVSERSVLIQFIYRFFNINDYAFNTYRLAAYESYREFMQFAQEKENMLSNYVNRIKQAAFQSLQSAINVMHRKLRSRHFPLIDLSETEEENALVAIEISPNPEIPDAGIGRQFMVKASMRPYLRQLGIDRPEGDILDWSDIRHAFFAKARQAHPDKNGSAEWFRNIKNALDKLKQQIFCEQEDNQQQNYSQWQDYFYEAYREFDLIMTRLEAGIAETNKEIAETNKGIAALNETYDELENELNKHMLNLEVEEQLLEYIRKNNISLPSELLPSCSSSSKGVSNPHCQGFFGSQPADQNQAELPLAENSIDSVFP